MKNADLFKDTFGMYATEIWSMPEKDFLEWLNCVVEQEPCDDCISRQAAQDYIAKYLSQFLYNDVREAVETIDEYIGELPSVTPKPKTGKWILVSERLPEEYREIIITDVETSDTYLSRYIGDGYWECDNGLFKDRIIAWMPLPEPYKEVSE